jgi:hypothetical protein
MTFEAKVLAPALCDPGMGNDASRDVANGGITLVDAPAGYLLTEGLALALSRLRQYPLWLRLGPEDADPATFLLSAVGAARRCYHDACLETLTLMRERPGPIFGLPPLFAQLARDLRACVAADGAVVLEDIHLAADDGPALSLAGQHLLPGLAEVAPCVLVSEHGTQAVPVARYLRKSAADLRLPAPAVSRLLGEWAPTVLDANGNPSIILSSAAGGSVQVDWTFSGSVLALLGDIQFTATLYADPYGPPPTIVVASDSPPLPTPPISGPLVPYTATIQILPGTVPANLYQFNIVVTAAETSDAATPLPIAGFIEIPFIDVM